MVNKKMRKYTDQKIKIVKIKEKRKATAKESKFACHAKLMGLLSGILSLMLIFAV